MVRPLDYQMGVEDEILAQIRKILQQAVSEIDSELATQPTGAIGDALSRAQAQAIATAAKSHLAGDWRDIGEILGEGRKLAAVAATQAFWDQIEEPLSTLVGGDGFNNLVRSQSVMAASRIDTVMARLSESKRSLSEQVWQTRALANGWIDSRINQALARGWDAKRLAKEVSSMINPDTPGGVSYAASRLARTEINNAFHSQTMEAMRNSGVVEYVKWNLSRSHPDHDICDDLAEHRLGEDIPGAPPKPEPELSKALPGLTKEQEDAVARYTANSFELNEKLRAGDDSDPMVKLLDDAIANSTLPRKTSVRRVITEEASYDALRAEKYGEAYSDPAFLSTQKKGHQSIEDLIEDFGVGRRRPIVLDIDLPKGYNALDIGGRLDDNPNSLGFDQGEVLLPRDAKFDITSYQNIGDYEILTLRPKRK